MRLAPFRRCSISALALVVLAGCGGNGGGGGGMGPNFAVSPEYQPTASAPAAMGNRQTVAVKVVDARPTKNRVAKDGREVIAEGDKGIIYAAKPLPKAVEDAVAASLQRAGFTVSPTAPVVVEVSLIDIPVSAVQFTHWNLPSERASTLDALGALVPGPVRETTAKIAASVAVRKHDARLGLSHAVAVQAAEKSDDRSVVENTLAQAISKAADEAVTRAGPDVELVSRTPVSAREIYDRQEELVRQQKVIADLTEMVASRNRLVEEDRQALADMKRQLEADRANAQSNAAADAQKVTADRAALQTERDALKAKLAEATAAVAAKPAEDPAAKAALAALQKQQADLDARAAALAQRAAQVDAHQKTLAEREQNLTAYAEKLKQQAAANDAFASDLAARQKEVAGREKALTDWKNDLAVKKTEIKPPPAVVERRRPLILITDPAAARTETTLANVTVTGLAIDDRNVADLRATINGQPVAELAPATAVGKGVGVRPLAGPVASSADGAYALKRFNFTAPLKDGHNEIVIEAVNADKLTATEKLQVVYDRGAGRIHILTIGINDYTNKAEIPALQYAVSDAKGVGAALGQLVSTGAAGAPDRRVTQVLNTDATRANLASLLFERLPTEVKPADTVMIYFSGHGAPSATTDDKGNVETYLLPVDADTSKLSETAIRMNDVGKILRRLRSERIVFLADTCYSGGTKGPGGTQTAGAKTVSLPGFALKGGVGIRTVPDRPQGKGTAILTASTGIQVAQEKTELGHGVFTHFLIEGLRGSGDLDKDGRVTVDELYEYLKTEVAKATNGTQTPQISRDATAGDIVLSMVKK